MILVSIRTVGIWWNSGKAGATETAAQLTRELTAHGVHTVMDRVLAQAIGRPDCALTPSFEGCDLIAVLGGDGTLLSGLDIAVPMGVPLLGINMGHLGFLSEIEPANLSRDIDQLLRGEYSIESRMMLEVEIPGCLPMYALNEATFGRAQAAMRILTLEVRANGQFVDRFAGDGLILSSPTGSTAYSLSAGGPVIAPGLNCIVMTPICPHTLHSCPVVLPDGAVLTVRTSDPGDSMQISLDGRSAHLLSELGQEVTVRRAGCDAKFVRLHQRNFFDLLHGKLSDWNR